MTQQPEYQPSEALLAAALEMFGNEAAARRWLAQPTATLESGADNCLVAELQTSPDS
ncbi:hypothetical protein [Deinococcus sp. SL84]|uniref:hypothetical protein n=1 Tax=Deinococcus sp. SL84 TaxID=2994663 RepID=UPI0022729901|nr:hypothetical protein [Deinococcus sp. SL84]MCY1704320.1 hypothetical protein [Deinococcus sp. SL84]